MHQSRVSLKFWDMIDPQLLSALNSPQDRMILLKLDLELERFMMDPSLETLEFPPMVSYRRMLLYKVAEYFMLDATAEEFVKPNGAVVKKIILTKNAESRIPSLRIRDLHVEDKEPTQSFKIMKRNPKKKNGGAEGRNKKTNSSNTNRNAHLSVDNRTLEKQRLEKREEAYQKVRARIFSNSPSPLNSPHNSNPSSPKGSNHGSRSPSRSPSPTSMREPSAFDTRRENMEQTFEYEFGGEGSGARAADYDYASAVDDKYREYRHASPGGVSTTINTGFYNSTGIGTSGTVDGMFGGAGAAFEHNSAYEMSRMPMNSNRGFPEYPSYQIPAIPQMPQQFQAPLQAQPYYFNPQMPMADAAARIVPSDGSPFYNPYLVRDVERRPPKSTELFDPNAPTTKKPVAASARPPQAKTGNPASSYQGRRNAKVKQPYFDYSAPSFRSTTQNTEPISAPHILEVYDYPKDLKSHELDIILGDLRIGDAGDEKGGATLRYIENSTVLAVFKSAEEASNILHNNSNPSYKLRRWNPQDEAREMSTVRYSALAASDPSASAQFAASNRQYYPGAPGSREMSNNVEKRAPNRAHTPDDVWNS